MAVEKNKLVKKAQKDYEYLTGDEATRRLQELREKAILDENSAYATGLKRGEERGKIEGESRGEARGRNIEKMEIAMAMIKNNVKREIIVKCTGINKEELDRMCMQKIYS